MLWAALSYSMGIIAASYHPRPPSWWTFAGLIFVAASAYFVRRRHLFATSLAFAALFLAGALNLQLRGTTSPVDTAIGSFADNQSHLMLAHVTRDGRLRQATTTEVRESLDIETDEIEGGDGTTQVIHAGIRLTIYRSHLDPNDPDTSAENPMQAPIPQFRYGDRIRLRAKLRPPRNFRNPGSFDYQGYLIANGISALGSAKAEDVEVLAGFCGDRIQSWRSRIHQALVAKVHQLWPPRQAALLDAMVIGEEAFIDRDTRVDFQRSGTFHVLVVSGMNVSILAFVVFWTLRRLRLPDIPATLLTVGFCVAYAFVTEVGAPVWRATLMCAIYLGARLLYRDRAMLNALGAAALGLLVFDPRQLFTASFQMTFLCVLIVAAIGLPCLDRTSQFYRRALAHWASADYGAVLPPRVAQFRLELRWIAARMAPFIGEEWSLKLLRFLARTAFSIYELLLVSAVMQMGLALPMAYYFHRATTIGLPANIVVVPLTELLMPAAVTALSLGCISTWLAKVPALLTAVALEGITGTVRGLGGLRLADLRVPTPSLVMIIASAAALALAMLLVRRRATYAAAGLLAILIASFALAFLPPQPQTSRGLLEVTSIDVGEGDSTLVVTPEGSTLLVDAGGPIGPGSQLDFGEDVVSPYLWTRGFAHLDAVAITHGHSDHVGGMPAILKNFRPHELWIGLLPPSEALNHLVTEANQLGIKVVRHWEGDQVTLGGAQISVLFPPRDWPAGPKPVNNDSMVLRIKFGDSSVLLEGDAEKKVERRVAALHPLHADLLKVGHHGSANATTPELLAATHPGFAVISVGSLNSFGLPRYETLDRLARSGARVYRTDVHGAVTFYLDGRTVTPVPAALRSQALRRFPLVPAGSPQ
jgi:competence protein ComEC